MNEEKQKIWTDYSLGKDIACEGQRPYVSKFSRSESEIAWDGSGYGVFSTKDYEAGEIIEEAPALVIKTTVEELVGMNIAKDTILLSKTLVYPTANKIFEELGHPLILPTGNFFAYNQSLDSNAEVEFSRKFNIVTIRAKKPIYQGSEIILSLRENFYGHTDIPIDSNQTAKEKKEMGCGCGKKNKKVTKILDGTEDKQPPKPAKPVLKEEPKFKSMVDGSTLKTINAKKKK